MANFLGNASNRKLNAASGSVPNVGGALVSWFQPMSFGVVTKSMLSAQVAEEMEVVNFRGTIQPLSAQSLLIKPEGQRDWEWKQVHSDPSLQLKNDDVIIYQAKQYRVMAVKDYAIYGYMEYHIIADYSGSGPEVVTP